MKQTKKVTLAAFLCALTVVILWLGAVTDVLDLSMAVIASLGVVFARLELGRPYPILIWIVSSALGLLLLPQKGAALIYALFGGVYPLVKAGLERLPRVLAWVCKIAVFEAAFWAYVLLAKYVFMLPDEVYAGWMLALFAALGLFTFVLYDIVLSRLIVFYNLRIRPRIARLLK